MTNKYKEDVDENGYPLDKGYLEVGLPSMLQESIDKMKITNQLIKEGKQCLDWDCDWCMLNSNFNIDASIFIGQVKHLEFDLIRNQSH